MGWGVAVALAGVLVWGGLEHARLEEKTALYAAALAQCANGKWFRIGEVAVYCRPVNVAVY